MIFDKYDFKSDKLQQEFDFVSSEIRSGLLTPYGEISSMLSAAVFARNKSCEYDTIMVYEESDDKDKFFKKNANDLMKLLSKDYGLFYTWFQKFVLVFDEEKFIGCLTYSTNCNPSCYKLYIAGSTQFIDFIKPKVNLTFCLNVPKLITRLCIDLRDQDIQEKEINFKIPEKIDNLRACYPYFQLTPEQYWDKFSASDENIMLLIGQAGTGKSTFILSMLNQRGWDNVYLIDSDFVLDYPATVQHIPSLPLGSVLIIEDTDNFISARETGNKQMSALLNLSAGVATSSLKIILSTNLPTLKSVDKALVRAGRCFDILSFKKLTSQQVNPAREVLGRNPIEIIDDKEYTLAEALNDKPDAKVKKFGFNNE